MTIALLYLLTLTFLLKLESKEEEILKFLEVDIKQLKDKFREVMAEIIAQGYSDYPILIAHPEDMAFADKIFDKEPFNLHFHFSASTLEAMIEKGIILEEKKEAMIAKMKVAKDAACILLLHPDIMRFIFAPLS